MRCYKIVDAGPIFEKFLQDGDVPHCDCGGVFKPNVTLFGEQLPVQTLLDAKAAARKADLIIVAGSSLEVAPVSELPAEALRHQAKIIVLNKQPTYINEQAELVIQDDLTHILPQIVNLVLQVA
jgi:NAD-dependent deacetylase